MRGGADPVPDGADACEAVLPPLNLLLANANIDPATAAKLAPGEEPPSSPSLGSGGWSRSDVMVTSMIAARLSHARQAVMARGQHPRRRRSTLTGATT